MLTLRSHEPEAEADQHLMALCLNRVTESVFHVNNPAGEAAAFQPAERQLENAHDSETCDSGAGQ